jgi:hypothetical protein
MLRRSLFERIRESLKSVQGVLLNITHTTA